ncbi:MAG: DUF427 domain-containing protein [Anaerolineales bacterium]|nr:DUF427 domain-containing protein [Anaerolineales bacterium]
MMTESKRNYNRWEPSRRWVRVRFGDEFVADSKNTILAWRGPYQITYYFPPEDVCMDLLEPTGRGGKGRETWHVQAGNRTAENAAWRYTAVPDGLDGIKGHTAFRWDKMDHWYEEEEEIFVHPRDPYHRVDTIPSSRHVRVVVDGVTVAESKRPFLLFETSLPVRYYLPAEDVRLDLLTPTDTHTACPYKGAASYWSVKTGDNEHKDIVWGYSDPIAEAPKIQNLYSFYNEKVDIYVDGELEKRPETIWS